LHEKLHHIAYVYYAGTFVQLFNNRTPPSRASQTNMAFMRLFKLFTEATIKNPPKSDCPTCKYGFYCDSCFMNVRFVSKNRYKQTAPPAERLWNVSGALYLWSATSCDRWAIENFITDFGAKYGAKPDESVAW